MNLSVLQTGIKCAARSAQALKPGTTVKSISVLETAVRTCQCGDMARRHKVLNMRSEVQVSMSYEVFVNARSGQLDRPYSSLRGFVVGLNAVLNSSTSIRSFVSLMDSGLEDCDVLVRCI